MKKILLISLLTIYLNATQEDLRSKIEELPEEIQEKIFDGAIALSIKSAVEQLPSTWPLIAGLSSQELPSISRERELSFHKNDQLRLPSSDQQDFLWNFLTGQKSVTPYESHVMGELATRPDRNQTARLNRNSLILQDRESSRPETISPNDGEWFGSFCFSPDNISCAVGLNDGRIEIRNAKSKIHIHTLRFHNSPVSIISYSKNGHYMASSSDNGVVVCGDSKKILSDYFKHSTDSKQNYLLWLILEYKKYLQEVNPARASCMRVQDLSNFAQHVILARCISVEELSTIARRMPVSVRRCLVKIFGIYDRSDDFLNDDLETLRRAKRQRISQE